MIDVLFDAIESRQARWSIWELAPPWNGDPREAPRSAMETEIGFRNVEDPVQRFFTDGLYRRRLFTTTPEVENNVYGRQLPRLKSVRRLARRVGYS